MFSRRATSEMIKRIDCLDAASTICDREDPTDLMNLIRYEKGLSKTSKPLPKRRKMSRDFTSTRAPIYDNNVRQAILMKLSFCTCFDAMVLLPHDNFAEYDQPYRCDANRTQALLYRRALYSWPFRRAIRY
jgi:hypothetical protein